MIEAHKFDQLEVFFFHILLYKTEEYKRIRALSYYYFFYLSWKPIVKIKLKFN